MYLRKLVILAFFENKGLSKINQIKVACHIVGSDSISILICELSFCSRQHQVKAQHDSKFIYISDLFPNEIVHQFVSHCCLAVKTAFFTQYFI